LAKDISVLWKVIGENEGSWLSAYTFFLEVQRLTNNRTRHTRHSVAQLLRGFNVPKRIKPNSCELEYFCPKIKF